MKTDIKESQYFCTAPFKLLNISPQGNVYSCYESSEIMGNIFDKNLKELWNDKPLNELRERIIKAVPSEQCNKCYQKERLLQGKSLRTQLNHQLSTDNLVKNQTMLSPELIDIAVSNTCNLKCRICGPYYSSLWMKEKPDLATRPRAMSEEYLKAEIFPLFTSRLKKIVLTGGEPLLEGKNKLILEQLLRQGLKDVTIEYNSNGTVCSPADIELWKEFKNIKLNLSLDDSHERFEYLRKGSSWNKVVQNIEIVKSEAPHIKLCSYSTLTVFNGFSFLDYVSNVTSTKLFNIDELFLHYLVDPPYYSLQVLNSGQKEELKKRYLSFMKNYLLTSYDFSECQNLILQMKMVINYMEKEDKSFLKSDLLEVTKNLDSMRGESYQTLFSHLDSI